MIEPGETQTVELSVFAQNAEDTVYTVSVQSTLVTTGKEVEDASIDLPFTCDPGDGQVSIEPQGAADPSTLVQTYKITNTGGSDIADLGLTLAGEDANYLRLDPLVENYPLAAGESITVELVPDLAPNESGQQRGVDRNDRAHGRRSANCGTCRIVLHREGGSRAGQNHLCF